MNKLLSFLLFSLFVSNILCGEVGLGEGCDGISNTCKTTVQECDTTTTNKCVCASGYDENKDKTDCVVKGDLTGPCLDTGACTKDTTQQCSSGYCVCATGLVEKKDGSDCEQPAAYGADCSTKNCADSTQTCDTTSNTCVCASGYKENSGKSGCEQDTSASGSGSGSGSSSDGNSSSFLKTSLLILLGITF